MEPPEVKTQAVDDSTLEHMKLPKLLCLELMVTLLTSLAELKTLHMKTHNSQFLGLPPRLKCNFREACWN